MGIEMCRQDLLELYQLLEMYNRTYSPEYGNVILDEIRAHYRKRYGEEAAQARNPRGAGRRKKYNVRKDQEIARLRSEGKTIREIAKETGCSVGYVQSKANG